MVRKEEKSENVTVKTTKNEEAPIKSTQPLDEIPISANKAAFDDKPIPKSNFNWSEYPEGGEEVVQETHYPMGQLLKSKAVKLKLQGLEELLKMLTDDPNNEEVNEVTIGSLLKETAPANM